MLTVQDADALQSVAAGAVKYPIQETHKQKACAQDLIAEEMHFCIIQYQSGSCHGPPASPAPSSL